tara:strand:+ start:70 stop:270 length:201 start_codon:yes stop_codon:yes gene_type:complete
MKTREAEMYIHACIHACMHTYIPPVRSEKATILPRTREAEMEASMSASRWYERAIARLEVATGRIP